MKQFIRVFLSFTLVMSVALPPQMAMAGVSVKLGEQIIKLAGEELKMVTSRSAEGLGKQTTVQLFDMAGNLKSTFVIPAASKAAMEEALPSKIAAQIAEKRKSLGARAGKAAMEQLIRLPVESFSFFLALGAVQFEQLIFNYAQDPLGAEHLINNQLDPVGQLSFYAFMLANHGSSHAMMSMLAKDGKVNPRLFPWIGNLGMSTGMIASNIVGEAAHSPNFLACASTILKQGFVSTTTSVIPSAIPGTVQGLSSEACDKAATAWNENGGVFGELSTWAPGLASLAATSLIMSSGQRMIARMAFRVSAVELAAWLVPGGLEIDTIRVLGAAMQVANLAVFTAISNAIEPFFTMNWKNYWQSDAFNTLEKNFVGDLSQISSKSWLSEHLNDDLIELGKAMKAWREMNLTDINMAQSNWAENLNNFAGLYNVSKDFYSDVISSMVERKKYPNYVSLLDRNFPLNGITPANWDKKAMPNPYYDQPDDLLKMQLETVRNVSQKLDQLYANNQAFLSGLGAHQRYEFLNILAGLRSQDPNKIGQATDQLDMTVSYLYSNDYGIGDSYYKLLKSVQALLGNPKPIWEKSAGYVNYFLQNSKWESTSQLDHQTKFSYSFWNSNYARTISNWLQASLVWGPDAWKGEKLTDTTAGFYSQFLPPKMPVVPNTAIACPNNPVGPTDKFAICENDVTYDNPLNFVVHHIRPELINEATFKRWWERYAETAYVQTWVDYENKYQDIVSQLVDKMWTGKSPITNHSDVANGIFYSAIQEWKTYAITLGGIMQIHLDQTGQVDLLHKLLSPRTNKALIKEIAGKRSNFFQSLLVNNDLDLKHMLQNQSYGLMTVSPPAYPDSHNFIWQNQLLTQIDWEFSQLLQKIKKQKVYLLHDGKGVTVLTSEITNAQIQEQQQKIQATLDSVAQLVAQLQLNPEQQKTAKICLDGISSVIQEVATVAQIANSVSYRNLTNGQVAKARCSAPQPSGVGRGMQFVQRAAEGCND